MGVVKANELHHVFDLPGNVILARQVEMAAHDVHVPEFN
jgi:hypothetical protein